MKIWGITCCKNCLRIGTRYNINGQYDYCFREKREIKNINILPKWCTLPEDKEENDANNS